MSLADEIRKLPPDEGCCTTGLWYQQQPRDAQEAFDEYIADVRAGRRRNYAPLYEVCRQNGLTISARAFRDHCRTHLR